MDGPTPPKRRRISSVNRSVARTIKTEITGKGCKYYFQVDKDLLLKYGAQIEATEMVKVVSTMQEYLRCETCTIDTLYQSFKRLYECVTCFDRHTAEEPVLFDRQNQNAKLFYELGGVETATRIIMLESLLPRHSKYREESAEKLRLKAAIFETIARLISSDLVGEKIAEELAQDEELFVHLFNYIKHDQTFSSACTLIEDILQNRPVVVLRRIPNLKEVIESLSGEKLRNFSRILAVTVSELDVYANRTSLFAQGKQKKDEQFVNVRDQNLEYLLEIPRLIEQLVRVVCSTDTSPRYRGLQSEVENWMQWIDNSNSDDLLEIPDTDTDVDEFVGGVSQPTEPEAPWCYQPSMSIINNLICKVECIHVLRLLMYGKHSKEVKKMFAHMKLIPGLSNAFDNFIWKLRGPRTFPQQWLAGHNVNCECSPESALKIQTLRFLLAFCEHSDYKHLLLTRSELAEIQRINEKAGVLSVTGLDNVDRANMCKGKEGLLTKMVDVMKKEPVSPNFQLYLARAVESYLRGTTLYCGQIFLLRRGVLQHVVNDLLNGEIRTKELIQSGFDLLGELIKFNIEAFKILDDLLRTPETKSKFVDLINKNLVDSNMFIRSVTLSYGFFCNEQQEHSDYAKKVNYLLGYMSDFKRQVNYLHEILAVTTIHSVSQDNVSCLNTALVLILSRCEVTDIASFLTALAPSCGVNGSMVLSDFRNLLLFWKDHYSLHERAGVALENSSRIKFSQWRATVDTLISEDSSLPTSLIHYVDSVPADGL